MSDWGGMRTMSLRYEYERPSDFSLLEVYSGSALDTASLSRLMEYTKIEVHVLPCLLQGRCRFQRKTYISAHQPSAIR